MTVDFDKYVNFTRFSAESRAHTVQWRTCCCLNWASTFSTIDEANRNKDDLQRLLNISRQFTLISDEMNSTLPESVRGLSIVLNDPFKFLERTIEDLYYQHEHEVINEIMLAAPSFNAELRPVVQQIIAERIVELSDKEKVIQKIAEKWAQECLNFSIRTTEEAQNTKEMLVELLNQKAIPAQKNERLQTIAKLFSETSLYVGNDEKGIQQFQEILRNEITAKVEYLSCSKNIKKEIKKTQEWEKWQAEEAIRKITHPQGNEEVCKAEQFHIGKIGTTVLDAVFTDEMLNHWLEKNVSYHCTEPPNCAEYRNKDCFEVLKTLSDNAQTIYEMIQQSPFKIATPKQAVSLFNGDLRKIMNYAHTHHISLADLKEDWKEYLLDNAWIVLKYLEHGFILGDFDSIPGRNLKVWRHSLDNLDELIELNRCTKEDAVTLLRTDDVSRFKELIRGL